MASPAPAKSQPLHNFSLPQLKWSKNHTSNHHRGRRPAESPPPPDSIVRRSPSSDTAARRHSPLLDTARLRVDSARRHQSPMRDSASETESGYMSEKKRKLASESGRISLFLSPTRDHVIDESEKRPVAAEVVGSAHKEIRSSKIYIRIPKTKAPDLPVEAKKPKSTDVVADEPRKVEDEGKKGPEPMDFDEYEGKTWNLRPRKPLHKKSNGNANAGASKGGGGAAKAQAAQQVNSRPEAISSRGGGSQPPADKEKKPVFSISLTKQEIEDDIFSLSGSKPSRRPKKRAKNVQRQLDNLFPGLWLQNVTPEMYKVSETIPKVK